MGRGRNTTGSSAAATTTNSTSADECTTASAKVLVKNARPNAEKMNGKEQALPAPDESDDSSQDASVRTTRRALQIAATKTQNPSATIPKQSDKTLNIRSRLRKSTQINHTASLNLVEGKIQKNTNRSASNRSSPAELVICNDQVSIVDGSVSEEMAPVVFHSTIEAADIDVAGDDNVVATIEICDEADNLSIDTDTVTTESSSLVPDSNEATCSADDERESSIFSEDSQIRSSSIVAIMQDESNSMQTACDDDKQNTACDDDKQNTACDDDKQNEQNVAKESPPPIQLDVVTTDADQAPTICVSPPEPEDRSLSSPDFFNLPKPKIVRTYVNKRKLRAEALKNGTANVEQPTQEALTNNKSPSMKDQDKSPSSDQPECRRSQRQRVIKYDVRDLFNMKGSRNNSETKNARLSQKTVRDSPRSDISSSPQTFRGFSDTDDTSSPVPFPRGRRNLKAAFDSKDLGILEESSSRSVTPAKTSSPVTVGTEVASTTTVLSVKSDPTPSQQAKVTRVPLKKEPSKPSRILPRRKTVLLNRSTGDDTDWLNGSSRATECSVNETEMANISASLQSNKKTKLSDKRPAKKSGNNIETENSPIVIVDSSSETADKSEIVTETPFANSSIQCDLEVTEMANISASLQSNKKTKSSDKRPAKKSGNNIETENSPIVILDSSSEAADKSEIVTETPFANSSFQCDLEVTEMVNISASLQSNKKTKSSNKRPAKKSGNNIETENSPIIILDNSSEIADKSEIVTERPFANSSIQCDLEVTEMASISASLQSNKKTKTSDKRPAKKSGNNIETENSPIVILDNSSQTADKSEIVTETPFANSSIQCDIEVTKEANSSECINKTESKSVSVEAVEQSALQCESINKDETTKSDSVHQEIFTDEGKSQTCNENVILSEKIEESKTELKNAPLKEGSEATRTTPSDSKSNKQKVSAKPKKSSKMNQKDVDLDSQFSVVQSSTPVKQSDIKEIPEEPKFSQTEETSKKSKSDKKAKKTKTLSIEVAPEVDSSKNDPDLLPKTENDNTSLTNTEPEKSLSTSSMCETVSSTNNKPPPIELKRPRSKGEMKYIAEDVKRASDLEIKAPDKSTKNDASPTAAKSKSTKSKKETKLNRNVPKKDEEKASIVISSDESVSEKGLNGSDDKNVEKIREKAKLKYPTEVPSSPKAFKEQSKLPTENVEEKDKSLSVDKLKRKAVDTDRSLTGSSKKTKPNAYDEIDIFAAADVSKILKDSKRSSSTKKRMNDSRKTTDSPILGSKRVEDSSATTTATSKSQLSKSETSAEKINHREEDRSRSAGSKDANDSRVNRKDSSTPKNKSSRSNRDNDSRSSTSAYKRKSETNPRLSKDDVNNSIRKDFVDKRGGKVSHENNVQNAFGKLSERDYANSRNKPTIDGDVARNSSTERSSSTKKQVDKKTTREERTSSKHRSSQKSSSRSLDRSSNSSHKRIITSSTEAGTSNKEAISNEHNSVEQKPIETKLYSSTQETNRDRCAADNRREVTIDSNMPNIENSSEENAAKDEKQSATILLSVPDKVVDIQQPTLVNTDKESIVEVARIVEKSEGEALSCDRLSHGQQFIDLSTTGNESGSFETVFKPLNLETPQSFPNSPDPQQRASLEHEKVEWPTKKRTQRSESIAKGRGKRGFSKSHSTSDGVSETYSSDSSDSKQTTSVNSNKSLCPELNTNLAEQSSLPPATNFPAVFNGLSTAVMNDLLEWTCHNKETLQQIQNTIGQSQRSVTSTSTAGTVDIKDETELEREEPQLNQESTIGTLSSASNEKTESQNKLPEPEKSSQSTEQLAVSENEATGTSSESNISKESKAILTSKEMLEELMNSSFDEDDNFSEVSELTTKSEPIPKSKLSQEIKRLMKCSESALALDSYGSKQTDNSSSDCSKNIRRSHRIKTQVKSSTVGRGLVRGKSDRNQNSTNALNLEAQNAKFLKDMEERLSQFQMIKDNEYKCERIISKEAKRMTCDCFLTKEEEERGELGCGEDCLNRLLMIECSSKCTVGERCTNRRFQQNHYAPCKVFRTEKKGFGIMADKEIPGGEFIMEYVGEVLNGKQFEKRAEVYCQDKNKHFYFMALRGDCIIDATQKGSISRFINHSCDPNAETQKWTVNGELRIGFFSKRAICAGEEITFDYQFQRYGKEAQKCYCESANCRGWIGEEPDSDEEEELSSSDSEEEIDQKPVKVELDVEKGKITEPSIQEPVTTAEPIAAFEADLKPPLEQMVVEKDSIEAVEEPTPIDIPTDKEKSERKALRAAEKFAKIAARMKARQERELIKQKKRLAVEDADLEAEVVSLEESGLKNQAHTLKFSRCMVRVKHLQSKLRLLSVLRNGDVACKRLFLDYHGLRLLHGWVCENETIDLKQDLEFRRETLITLELIPIPNKTMLKDSKVFDVVQNWLLDTEQQLESASAASDSPPPMKKSKLDADDYEDIRAEIKNMALKLTTAWEELPEVFRIPKRERIEQMKEHEREANRRYKALGLGDEDTYNSHLRNKARFGMQKMYKWSRDKHDKRKELASKESEKVNSAEANLTKLQRRQLFAAKVAKDEAEKRLAEERREFDCKCKFYGLDPRVMTPNTMPFCVNPATGQWFSKEKRKIATPPSHAHIKVPPKPQSRDPKDYKMPELDLPPMWTYAMDSRGRLYYYHVKIRIPQWEPPIKILPLTRDTPAASSEEANSIEKLDTAVVSALEPQPSTSRQALGVAAETSSSESDDTESDISCSEIIGLKKGFPLKIGQDTIEELRRSRKRKRFSRLVQERTISPRREEDRAHNQVEMRRYRENKEKIRRRKEEIKRRKAQLRREMGETSLSTSETNPELPTSPQSSAGDNSTVPIQDYLLSSDEEGDLEKSEYNNSLIEKIVHGDNIVDELDAIAKEKPLKRSLPFVDHDAKKKSRMDDRKRLEGGRSSDKPSKSRKSESSKPSSRKSKEKFRSEIAGIIVHHLTPYRRDTCQVGRITNNEDFKHLARKLTHFVLLKELKHCDMTGQTLVVTESVKNKSREFIKKYMAKYGDVYIRPANDPEFRDIPL